MTRRKFSKTGEKYFRRAIFPAPGWVCEQGYDPEYGNFIGCIVVNYLSVDEKGEKIMVARSLPWERKIYHQLFLFINFSIAII